jgi:uncharacterized protein YndB with AHSA1/START domain
VDPADDTGQRGCWSSSHRHHRAFSTRVLSIDPPDRIVFTWDISPHWQIETDPERSSEVEVRFLADGPDRTRVELEHRNLERHGDGWPGLRGALESEGGWPLYLQRFAALVAEGWSTVDREGEGRQILALARRLNRSSQARTPGTLLASILEIGGDGPRGSHSRAKYRTGVERSPRKRLWNGEWKAADEGLTREWRHLGCPKSVRTAAVAEAIADEGALELLRRRGQMRRAL